MKARSSWLFFVTVAVASAQAPAWFQTDFPAEEFKARWSKIYEKISDQAILVMQGVPRTPGYIMPRQTNEFYYLTGIETPHAYLLLDGRTKRATLYMPPRNRQLESAEGRVLSADDADQLRQLTGADAVVSNEQMKDDWLGKSGGVPQVIYTLLTPAEGNSQARGELRAANNAIATDPWDGRVAREQQFANLLKTRYPKAEVKDITPIIDELRGIKSPREI